MEKEFVPYELAVKLKELGFDELCLCHYHYGNILRSKIVSYVDGDCLKFDKFDKSIPAPLWQQAFDWFREKHKLVGYTGMDLNGTLQPVRYFFAVQKSNLSKDEDHLSRHGYKTYQEASQACLEKLIQIIADENKTNTN